jgi:hypothetical protein
MRLSWMWYTAWIEVRVGLNIAPFDQSMASPMCFNRS